MNRGARQTIVAWWLFLQLDSVGPFEPDPEWIAKTIEYAEDNAAACDVILSNEYEEYIPQKV